MPHVFSRSEVGGHAENEDAFEVAPHPDDPECLLCAVADGQGGQAGGGLAARTACRACVETAARHRPADLQRPEVWVSLLRRVDEAVAKQAGAGLTTLAAFAVQAGGGTETFGG